VSRDGSINEEGMGTTQKNLEGRRALQRKGRLYNKAVEAENEACKKKKEQTSKADSPIIEGGPLPALGEEGLDGNSSEGKSKKKRPKEKIRDR